MKSFFTIFLLCLTHVLSAQTVFVNATVVGGLNNGTSWPNAFISLDAALAVAAPGQAIWVSAGTYKPATTFLVQTGVAVYGGFSGTETALNQRNPLTNVCILSGDLLGNDVLGNFTLNRADNAQHVMTIFANTSSASAVVDGFIIRNGHTLSGSANADLTRRGGGILAGAKVTVRNCTFTQNFGDSGAGLAAIGTASDGIILDNCLFEANSGSEQGICYLRQTPTGVLKNCVFRKNTTNRGALYPQETESLLIDSCLFDGNNAGANFGSAMFSWQANWTLKNSIFRNNKSANAGIYIDDRVGGHFVTVDSCLFERDTATGFGGAGIYGWQATALIKNSIFRQNHAPSASATYFNGQEFDSQFSIEGCLFEDNVATGYGGTCLYNNRTNYTLSSCTFRNNTAVNSAAAIYNGDTTIFNINNCLFENNRSLFAAAVANYGIGCAGTFENCLFQGNAATQGGGAVSNGFKANALFKSTSFIGNEAAFGGAIFTQNDTTRLRVDDCFFSENTTSGAGGSIFVNRNIAARIQNSTFTFNTGDTGGAINAVGDSALVIENTVFMDNFAGMQGAALNLSQVNLELTNCLFARNINVGSGSGGAISNNASDSTVSSIKAINCTFAENEAAMGAGIAQWEDGTGSAELSLLNCLFQNASDNYEIEAGTPTVISLNGNQSSDASFSTYLTANKDVHDLGVTFFDPINNDYSLTMGPAVDGGVAEGAPLTDLLGNPHLGLPDRGCYELGINGVTSPSFQLLSLKCAPNPALDFTMITLQSDRLGDAEITVWNQAGQRVLQQQVRKTAPEFSQRLDLNQLPAGAYRVAFRMGSVLHEGGLIKG